MNLYEMSWPKIDAMPRTTPVVVPIAALEQHGHHLPVFTDSMLLGEIWRRAHEKLGDRVLSLPLMWLGNSDHHLDFPGTISAAPRVYLDMLAGLIDNLVFHGFQRILLINGHGGNDVPGRQAIFEARQRYRARNDLRLLFTTYWGLGSKPWEVEPAFKQREMGHACEWETSMILRLAPHLVGDYKSAPEISFGQPYAPAHMGWITKDRSTIGHIGSPHLATPEKGEVLFDVFSKDLVKLIELIAA
ncbi:MAG: creatininase family protein [Pirellulaceae bacterium]|nr:creatininase family protein [Pirellulaceae bacterium]